MNILKELSDNYVKVDSNLFSSGVKGYWSNLNKGENEILLSSIKTMSSEDAIKKYQPLLYDVIFSPKRAGGLELLNLSGDETCVDYGCMWGALTVPLARRCKYVLGVDQTMDSLRFLKARVDEESMCNVHLLCCDLRTMLTFKNKFDIAIVNGVLEWIPEQGEIELKSYYAQQKVKEYSGNPREQQVQFLKKVYENLCRNGKIYLAIENRYDYKMFFGVKDPHSGLLLTSIVPRRVANMISMHELGRPYVNWTYSIKDIERMLMQSGFSKVDLYMCFPDYRCPEKILPYRSALNNYKPVMAYPSGKRSFRKILGIAIEKIIFKYCKMRFLCPSIIAIGEKC